MIIRQRDQQHQPTLKPRTDSIFNSDAAELFENVATFKSLGLVQIIIECMHEKIRSRLTLTKTCYHLSNYLLSSYLLVKTYRLKCMKQNFSIVLHGCETQYFTLSKKHKQRVFKNGVLRKIFGSKRKEKRGGLKNLNNELFQNLYSLPNIINVIKSVFYHFFIQFMPLYHSHTLITLM